MENSRIINGDCLEELKKLEDNSIDLLCTDPPYGYGFMGKHWDKFEEKQSTKSQSVGWMSPGMKKSTYGMREFFIPIWKEALRVLKPGAFSFVMSAPRSDVQMVMLQTLAEAGFDVSFTPIYWTYATGFPKAMNIGKKTEKENLEGSYAGYQPKPAVEVVIVAMKPLDQNTYVGQALNNQKGVTWLDDCRIPFAGMDDQEQFDKDNVAGHQKFIEKRDDEMYGGGWDKPARKTTKRKPREENTVFKTSGFKSENNDTAEASPFGRFAANLLVSDDVLNVKSKGQLAPTTGKEPSNYKENNTHGSYLGYRKEMKPRDDGDSFSRYYDLDAWWEDRLTKLPDEIKRTFPFLAVPKPSKSEKNMGLDKFDKQQKIFNGQSDKPSTDMKGVEQKFTTQPSANNHPTVKPTTLMSYLVTLGSRKGDVVLDPFAGSGTTGISCVFSERNYLLIEREKEYFDILKARIKKAENPHGLIQHEWF